MHPYSSIDTTAASDKHPRWKHELTLSSHCYGLNIPITVFRQGSFGIRLPKKVDMTLNKETKRIKYEWTLNRFIMPICWLDSIRIWISEGWRMNLPDSDGTLLGTANLSQNESDSNGNNRVVHTPHSPRAEASPSEAVWRMTPFLYLYERTRVCMSMCVCVCWGLTR